MARRYYHKTRSYAWLWWLLLTALLVYGGWITAGLFLIRRQFWKTRF